MAVEVCAGGNGNKVFFFLVTDGCFSGFELEPPLDFFEFSILSILFSGDGFVAVGLEPDDSFDFSCFSDFCVGEVLLAFELCLDEVVSELLDFDDFEEEVEVTVESVDVAVVDEVEEAFVGEVSDLAAFGILFKSCLFCLRGDSPLVDKADESVFDLTKTAAVSPAVPVGVVESFAFLTSP